jgi:hypothetical protein
MSKPSEPPSPVSRSSTDDKKDLTLDGHPSPELGKTVQDDEPIVPDQDPGVTKIEALCEFSRGRLVAWQRQIFGRARWLMYMGLSLDTDAVFGRGWKIWLLYLFVIHPSTYQRAQSEPS